MAESVATKNTDRRTSAKQKLPTPNETSIHEILHHDHLKVSDMFFQYDQLEDEKEKEILAQAIVRELFVHAMVEEQVVYSAVRKEAADDEETEDLMDEAQTEHHVVNLLMAEISAMQSGDDLYDAKICVLGESVRHHVREEEKNMFAKMKEAEMDLEKLGQKFLDKKADMLALTFEEITSELNKKLEEQKVTVTKKKKAHK